MIRLLVKLGAFLDKRFPEKVVVARADYEAITARLAALESKAVHVDAVKVVIGEVEKLKDEVASFKTSLGMNRTAEALPSPSAYLNDLPVGVYDDNQR
jgi:hypothetical protein